MPEHSIYSGIERNAAILPSGQFYATNKTSYSIDDIIALNGERVPNADESQKQFKVLNVAITGENSNTGNIAQIVQDINWFAGNRPGRGSGMYNFRQATENRASLIMTDVMNSYKLNPALALKNITLDAGSLAPSFNPNVFNYTVKVDETVEKISITGISDNSDAIITGNEIDLPLTLDDYTNATITVTLPNGESWNYRISILRGGDFPPVSFTWEIHNAEQMAKFHLGANFGEQIIIDWGDGSPEETFAGTGWIDREWLLESGAEAFSHTYSLPGSYTVTVRGAEESPVWSFMHNIDGFRHNDYRIKQIDLRAASQLRHVEVYYTENTELDISKNKLLTMFTWNNGYLSTLDVSNNTALQRLYCIGNRLTELDISNNKALQYLSIPGNQLTLENMYDISEQLAHLSANDIRFGTQRLPYREISTNTPFYIASSVLGGINSEFEVNTAATNYTLHNGEITFHARGEYTVTATNPAITYTQNAPAMVVRDFYVIQPVTGLTLDCSETSLFVNSTLQLTAIVTPYNSNDYMIWSSSDSDIATVVNIWGGGGDETTAVSNGLVTGISPGVVTITVSSRHGDAIASCVVTVSEPSNLTGAEELFDSEMRIYPNPFADEIRITGAPMYTHMQIINATGAIVYTQMLTNPDETVNLENLSAGVYVLRFEKNGKVKAVKVVKK